MNRLVTRLRSGIRVGLPSVMVCFLLVVTALSAFAQSANPPMLWYNAAYAGHVTYSPDGSLLAISQGFGTVGVFRASDGVFLYALSRHDGTVNAIAFSPDGKYVLTGSGDNTAQLWNMDFHEDLRRVCARLTRDLTPDERVAFGITGTQPTCPAK